MPSSRNVSFRELLIFIISNLPFPILKYFLVVAAASDSSSFTLFWIFSQFDGIRIYSLQKMIIVRLIGWEKHYLSPACVQLIVGASVFLLHFDLDGFRFCLRSLWNLEIQHTILERSLNFSFINIVRQRKATGKDPVVSFDSMELFPFLFFFLFSLSPNRQDTIVYSNFDILLIYLGNLHLNLERFIGLSNVYPGSPVACCDDLLASSAMLSHRFCVAFEQVINLSRWIPSY